MTWVLPPSSANNDRARFGQAPLCAPALAVGAVVRYRRKRWAPTSREGLLAGSALKKSASWEAEAPFPLVREGSGYYRHSSR
jgi:hypothetical protein